MNIEVCKKCSKLKGKRCATMLHEDNNEFTPVIINIDNVFNDWICQMKVSDPKHIIFIDVNGNKIPYVDYKNIDVYDDCPFLTEHKLYDWNT